MGKERDEKFQHLHDVAMAVEYMRPDLAPICRSLIRSIESDVVETIKKAHPELDLKFPKEKKFDESAPVEEEYLDGFRAGWNACADAVAKAHNLHPAVVNTLYKIHENSAVTTRHFYWLKKGAEEMQKAYKEYRWAVETGHAKDTSFGGEYVYSPVNQPDEEPQAQTYDERFLEQLQESELHSSFIDLIRKIEKPELTKVQKNAVKKFRSMSQRPELER